jgi:Secretion system C-terminal sorting domain
MPKQLIILFLLMIIFSSIKAQSIKGLYVDGFSTILGNVQKEDSLLRFAKNNGFNYLTLYQMHIVNATTPLNNASACVSFSNFINKAKTQFGILQIGVAGENYNFFANNIYPYNQHHTLASEKIDVYNLEFEFWVPSSINPGGVYCIDYLTNAGYTCDSAGAFTYYKKMLSRIDSLANADGKISETYFGWFSAQEGTQIVQSGVDRILLSAYIPSASYTASYQLNYLENRLKFLGSNNAVVKVLPIYSAEPNFMQTWASTNPFFKPYTDLQNSLLPLSFGWVPNIHLEGIQWFAYTDMPKINLNLGIEKIVNNKLDVYPNPSNNFITINIKMANADLLIADCTGRIMLSKTNISEVEKINVTSFCKGVYILEIKNKYCSIRKKIVVQ